MIKDVFKLKKRGWYTRLVKWMWNIDYRDFSHMCPFFWLAVLSVLILVPYSIVRAIIFLCADFFDGIGENVRKAREASRERNNEKWGIVMKERRDKGRQVGTDEELLKDFAEKLYYHWDEDHCLPKDYEGVWDYVSDEKRDAIHKLIEQIREERKAVLQNRARLRAEAIERERLAMIARKARINRIVSYAKPIGKGFLILLAGASAIVVLYFLYKGFMWLTTLKAVVWAVAGWTILALALLALLIFGLTKVKWGTVRFEFKMSCTWKRRWTSFFMGIYKYIIYPIWWIFKGIAKIFQATFMVVKNECPAIEWED